MIKKLVLSDFRNHFSCEINTAGFKNIVITGPNGSGKTAILEAISMLSGDRGMRGAGLSDIASFDGGGGFSAFAQLENQSQICVYYNFGDSNRRAKIDGDNAPLSTLADILRIVWLTPKEDRLFIDSAKDIRVFFDRIISSFNPDHFGRTAKLAKLLSERTAALSISRDKNWLDALDTQIAKTSVAIAAARINYLSELNYFLRGGNISVDGKLESQILENTASSVENSYFQYLTQNRQLVFDKMVLDGVHKSDFIVFNNELNLKALQTSTGQQKSLLIDLILAHIKLINAKTGKSAILLLDEFASHLDSNALDNLFTQLNSVNAQVWITGLTPDIFRGLDNALFVACKNGAIDNIL
jgi:DNA replication and repair protein RecF